MAGIEKFNDHCWKDVIPQADLALYSGWRRETFVGARPALLAIDLYDLVYRGGPHPPYELNERYPNTCGIFAHRAIAPTKQLLFSAAVFNGDPAGPGDGRVPARKERGAACAGRSGSRLACIAPPPVRQNLRP